MLRMERRRRDHAAESASGSRRHCDGRRRHRLLPRAALPRLPRRPPRLGLVVYLGRILPFAIISILVIYCLRNTSFTAAPFGVPEIIAVALAAAIHVWKRNNLLSIGISTVVYMFLLQVVFV